MKFKIGEQVKYSGIAELTNPCIIALVDDNARLYNVIDAAGNKLWVTDKQVVRVFRKHYTDVDVVRLMVNSLDMNSDEIAELCGVKSIGENGNEVYGVQQDNEEVEITSDDLLQAIAKKLEGNL